MITIKASNRNTNKHTEKGMQLLEKSIDEVGVIESISVTKQGTIISGHARKEKFDKKGFIPKPITLNKNEYPVIVREDIEDETDTYYKAQILANTTAHANYNIDVQSVEVIAEELDLKIEELGVEVVNSDEIIVQQEKKKWVPDCLFPSNNPYEIPTLLEHKTPIYMDLPLKPWGAEKRSKQGVGTYHFYVDDYRFEAIWDDPSVIIKSGCKNIVEPNCSLYETTPTSYGIFQIYKKRWIARFLQDYDIRVFVDLNVTEKFSTYNKMGIPNGYNAFFTRGYESRINNLKKELQIAQEISGLQNPNLVVYGGGKKAQEFCYKHNLTCIRETSLDL